MLRRGDDQQRPRTCHRGAKITCRLDCFGQRHAGQKKAVLAARGNGFNHFGLARPQPYVAASAGGGQRQRRSPGASPDHADGVIGEGSGHWRSLRGESREFIAAAARYPTRIYPASSFRHFRRL